MVVAVGEVVAVEPLGHVGMTADAGARVLRIGGIGHEGPATANVIHMAMRIDDGVEAILVPAPDRGDDARAALRIGRVERHEAIIGFEQDRMRERLDHRDAAPDLGQFVIDAVERADAARAFGSVDDGAGHRQKIGHRKSPPLVVVLEP